MPEAQDHLFQSFRHPIVSLFQSAVAVVEGRSPGPASPPPSDPAIGATGAATSGSMLHALSGAAGDLVAAAPAGAAAMLRRADGTSIVQTCAAAYLKLALAEASQNEQAVKAARADLPRYGVCDDRWAEALEEFLAHYTLTTHADVPYRPWRTLDDFVIEGAGALEAHAKVAIISDWGTGEARPQALLRQIANHQPDVLIHLGDIYYACNEREANRFVDDIRAVFPVGSPTRVFTLCGNHDMYSGAKPYYAALDRLGQPASFFCLRNADWQFLALDTGYNDYDPFQEASAITWVRDGTDGRGTRLADDYSELAWHADKLDRAGARKTVVLSHHPLFTRNFPIGHTHAVNDRLHRQFAPWLDTIALWLWGHEHNLVGYAPFLGLARGRCLGAGAIPTLCDDDIYQGSPLFPPGTTVPDLLPQSALRHLQQDPGLKTASCYQLGYAVIELDGPDAQIGYFGFNSDGTPPTLLGNERLTEPPAEVQASGSLT